MTRETAAQRKLREAEEKIAEWCKVKEEHPERLMMLMANFANLPGFSFAADADGEQTASLAFTFKVDSNVPGVWGAEYCIHAELQTWNEYYELESAERNIASYYEHLAEEERKEGVRRAALAKLNKEERELLGINL